MTTPVPLFADIALATACIVAEAGNQPFSGQVAVAEVIRNRTARKYSSDGTLAGTIFKPYQFSWLGDQTPWRPRIFKLNWADPQVKVAERAWLTANAADGSGKPSNVAGGAVLYHTVTAPAGAKQWPPAWASRPSVKEVARIGDHVFYDDTGR